jgi:hypothetical protein
MRLIGAVTAALFSAHCGNAGGGDQDQKDLAICHAPASVSGSPQTIEDVTALVNALAEEHGGTVDLPCFLSSLRRPLGVGASESIFSAQPAAGPRSPRMFLWSGALVMTVAPEDVGRTLLELGLQTTPTRSIKAEIEFPVTAPLSLSAPYDRVMDAPLTKCGVCHAAEEPAKSVSGAQVFESEVLRPADSEEIDLWKVLQESRACDPSMEPQRCALLGAIFDQGGIHAQAFSREAGTIYND